VVGAGYASSCRGAPHQKKTSFFFFFFFFFFTLSFFLAAFLFMDALDRKLADFRAAQKNFNSEANVREFIPDPERW
jgi:hypothetical protein